MLLGFSVGGNCGDNFVNRIVICVDIFNRLKDVSVVSELMVGIGVVVIVLISVVVVMIIV